MIGSRLGALWRRVRRSADPDQAGGRVDEEIAFHLAMSAARNRNAGMTTGEAHVQARRAFGNPTGWSEAGHDTLRHRWLEQAAQDIRIAVRRMTRRRGFVALTVTTLALGLGAVIAVFTLVDGVLLQPLPYPASARLISIQQRWNGHSERWGTVSPAEYFDYTTRLESVQALGAYAPGESDLATPDQPEHLRDAGVSVGLLDALQTHPQLGRNFTAAEDARGVNDEILISALLWRRRFGGRPGVVGQRVTLNGAPVTIVGVLPDDFRFPTDLREASGVDIVYPLGLDRRDVHIRGSHDLTLIGRIRPGVTVARANADVAGLGRSFLRDYPAEYPTYGGFAAQAVPLKDAVIDGAGPALLLLLAAAAGVLLIACTNAAGLLLAQGEGRRREVAVRRALGSGTGRLVGQALIESLLLAGVATIAGLILAAIAVHLVATSHAIDLPRLALLHIDARSAGFAAAISVLVAGGVGLAPALRLAGVDLQSTLRDGGRGATGGTRERALRRALITAQIAVALVLLVGASLLTHSFVRLLAVDPGFQVDHVLIAPVSLGGITYPTDTALTAGVAQLTAALGAIPGVRAAGAVAGAPLVRSRGDIGIELEGHPVPPGGVHPKADWQVVTPGYFAAIGMRLREGRLIDNSDQADHPGVVVVNQAMAQQLWPGASALGHRFKLGGGTRPDTVTVIGVVADVHQAGLAATPDAEMYLAYPQFRFWGGGGMLRSLTLTLRTSTPPAQLAEAMRATVHNVAPSLALGTIRTMDDVRRTSVALPRFMMLLLVAAGVIAAAISVVGLYGLMSYSVTQRTRELGVRLALGARVGSVIWLVTREGGVITAIGIAIGVPASLLTGRLLTRFLFGVQPGDPLAVAGVALLLTAVGLLAAYVPARRASRVDPVRALRGE